MFLSLKKVNFGYSSNKYTLKDITFSLEKGKTLALVGSSGCGKSTLLRIISGLLSEKNGYTLRGDISISGHLPEEYKKSGKFAFMFQEPTLFPNRTVFENVNLPLEIINQKNNIKVKDILHSVGLLEFKDYYPKRLSGGMKTRVALARSFVTSPELLLLDEPFSALDIAWKNSLYHELRELQKIYGTTVVLVSHDLKEALDLSENNIIALSPWGTILLNSSESGKNISADEIEKIIVEHHSKKGRIHVA